MNKNCNLRIAKYLTANNPRLIINSNQTEIFIPYKFYDSRKAYGIAISLIERANKTFNAKTFGAVASLNNSYSDGIAVNIHPSKLLNEAYQYKSGTKKTLDDYIFERDARKRVEEERRMGIDEFGDSKPLYSISSDESSSENQKYNELATDEKIQEAKNILQRIVPNIPVEIIDDYIKVYYNSDAVAVGKFENGLITLSKKSEDISITALHEAFHGVFAGLKQINPSLYEKILEEGSKKYGIARGESKANVKYSVEQQNQIDYTLKSINILSNLTDKQKQDWDKWEKGTISSEQLVDRLQIPKEQKEIVLESLQDNKTPEQVTLDITNKYSYTVEINTAKERTDTVFTFKDFEYKGDKITTHHKNTYREYFKNGINITREEWDNIVKNYRENKLIQLHSNLTVNEDFYKNNPDWEYRIQQIVTPLITPSIQNHSFGSKEDANKIGWVRAWYNKKTGEVHVLEVQSDLFQKGRDIKSPDEIIQELQKSGRLEIKCS